MSSSPPLTKAMLIPMNGDKAETDETKHIIVQFNPTSLRVTLSNTLKAENGGGKTSNAAQFIDKSESTLAVQLLFDTTVSGSVSGISSGASGNATKTETQSRLSQANHEANTDVRLLTKAIAETYMNPTSPSAEKPGAPKRCRFQWGSFVFVGMISGYNETLDYFSPEGVPLRATLALTLKEDRYQFETDPTVSIGQRNQPSFAPGGDDISAAAATAAAQKNPREWRDVALFNGLENPRLSAQGGLSMPGISLGASVGISASAGLGFRAGSSAALGTDIPGAFSVKTAKAKTVSVKAGIRLDARSGLEG